jgi:hypothetical protein
MDNKENLHRADRLKELVDAAFNGSIEDLRRHIKQRTGAEPNQGELSQLRSGKKSFGYKKAGTLADQIGLNRKWFEMPTGTNLQMSEWLDDAIHYKLQADPPEESNPAIEAAAIINKLDDKDQLEILHWLRVEEVRRRQKDES